MENVIGTLPYIDDDILLFLILLLSISTLMVYPPIPYHIHLFTSLYNISIDRYIIYYKLHIIYEWPFFPIISSLLLVFYFKNP